MATSPGAASLRRFARVRFGLCLACSLPLLSGCLGVGIGLGAAGLIGFGPERERIRGEIDGTLSYDYAKVVAAASAVLTDLEFKDIKKSEDVAKGKTDFEARTLQDRSISVTVKREGLNLTQVGVHMEIFGDRDMSRVVLEKIRQKLDRGA